MANRRIAILGSCVSADLFRLEPKPGEMVSYHARTSLLSIMSPPLPLDDQAFQWSSGFGRRAIKADFEKTFFDDVRKAKCDLLLIDFVDERWDLLRTQNSFVTRSADFKQSGVERSPAFAFELVRRLESKTQCLWRAACTRFAAQLWENLPNVPVVLHRVAGARRYRDCNAIRNLAPVSDGIPMKALSPVLKDCYDFFLQSVPRSVEIDLTSNDYLADEGHRWGLSPFHFEERYYRDVEKMLREF